MNIDTNTIFSMTEANQNFLWLPERLTNMEQQSFSRTISHAMKYECLMILKQMKLHLMKMFLTFPKSY